MSLLLAQLVKGAIEADQTNKTNQINAEIVKQAQSANLTLNLEQIKAGNYRSKLSHDLESKALDKNFSLNSTLLKNQLTVAQGQLDVQKLSLNNELEKSAKKENTERMGILSNFLKDMYSISKGGRANA